ncbi:branched-chain amino acid ABC transporter permease [Desulfosarcina ovata]|uniref:Branched-chain amino acid ABC transporter permease n=1 Tax=Desulfosarcina ovata subsp. ovata TaxID=2752305 RepID=A0A5K8AE19_9BACT|nr:branched-chain amino acid ABC transporter permease [Desulfosarcina ovata]BBO90234.1 branched-chain amino acid ABC transporter permease [Desulfosarcina ovata subsp. ovata]
MMTTRDKLFYFLYLHRTGLTVFGISLLLLVWPLVERNPYNLGLSNLIAIYALVVLGLNLFIGYTGQISLGHAAFFAIGAYGSAIGTTTFGLPVWPVMVAVALATALVALAVGLPALKLSGHYLAMATLGFNIVVYTILVQWDVVTGGPSGFAGIPYLAIGPLVFDNEVRFHYLVWTFAMLALLLCLNLVRSGVGRGLAALAEDETAAAALGVDIRRAKIKVFVLSAVLAALAGSLFAHCYAFVSPDSFGIFVSVDFVIMVVVGGMGSIWGTLFGTALITLLPEWIESLESFKDILHGLILVLILLFLPQGLVTGIVDAIRTRIAVGRHHA